MGIYVIARFCHLVMDFLGSVQAKMLQENLSFSFVFIFIAFAHWHPLFVDTGLFAAH